MKKCHLRDRHPIAGSGSPHQLRDTSGGKIEIHTIKSLGVALIVTVLCCADQPCHALGAIHGNCSLGCLQQLFVHGCPCPCMSRHTEEQDDQDKESGEVVHASSAC